MYFYPWLCCWCGNLQNNHKGLNPQNGNSPLLFQLKKFHRTAIKNLLDAVGIDMSMDDTDKFIAAVIGCPISTVTTYRNKFNEWGRKADEARLSKLQTIQGLSEALLNPEGKNEQNQVVKKFLSSIGKTVRDAKEASKKKK